MRTETISIRTDHEAEMFDAQRDRHVSESAYVALNSVVGQLVGVL